MSGRSKRYYSIYELVRYRLNWRKIDMADALGELKQWFQRKHNPDCAMTIKQLVQLYEVSGLSAEEFMELCVEAAKGTRRNPEK